MVRRRAVAALGEFLFYAATQLDEDNEIAKIWEIKEEAVITIYKQLGMDVDVVTKHYAVKTIQNITAQSKSAGILFSTLDIATALLSIYNSTSNNGLKISTAISISHICKINPMIFPTIFESLTCQKYCKVLLEGPQRVQQAFITMLNIALTNSYLKLNDSLMKEPIF